jgi:hypothetical protein
MKTLTQETGKGVRLRPTGAVLVEEEDETTGLTVDVVLATDVAAPEV